LLTNRDGFNRLYGSTVVDIVSKAAAAANDDDDDVSVATG